MQPVLAGWDKKYAEKGLVVVDADNGNRDTLQDLSDHVKSESIQYKVLFDDKAQNATAYGVKGFPAAFLIDASGKVIWEGFPLPQVDEVEASIEKALADVKPEKKKEETKKTEKLETTPSGLKFADLKAGTGTSPKTGDTVRVHYTGWLENGTKFDSSVDRGEPFEFTLGRGEVIKGWDEGVGTMKVGGKRKLVIPPALAYGDDGQGETIPPKATLVFEVELLGIGGK